MGKYKYELQKKAEEEKRLAEEKREIHVRSGANIGSIERVHPYVDMTPLPPNFMWGALGPSSGCEERLLLMCKWI